MTMPKLKCKTLENKLAKGFCKIGIEMKLTLR